MAARCCVRRLWTSVSILRAITFHAFRRLRPQSITHTWRLFIHCCSKHKGKEERIMNMKYVDEYRDPELAKRICGEIAKLSDGQPLKLMEVCGGHTHTIYKHGIEDVLPRNIDLMRGPGCPVSAWARGRLD